jgi:hypothetical protein
MKIICRSREIASDLAILVSAPSGSKEHGTLGDHGYMAAMVGTRKAS